jgi:hypothetical protein
MQGERLTPKAAGAAKGAGVAVVVEDAYYRAVTGPAVLLRRRCLGSLEVVHACSALGGSCQVNPGRDKRGHRDLRS